MTVGKDTIQTLLRQRQALRQALQDLHKDIASLDANASDLVAKNIKNPALRAKAADPVPEKKEVQATQAEVKGAVPTSPEPKVKPEIKQIDPSTEAARDKNRESKNADPSPVLTPAHSHQAEVSNEAYRSLLNESKQLSSYYLRHPSPDKILPLQQLDDAIAKADNKATKQDRLSEYQNLRKSYREVAGPSFSDKGINGKTLVDSQISAHILWVLPMLIGALVLVVFPLLLLGRTLALEMFTDNFASDLIWIFGVAAAFLWGAAGALTLLSVQVAMFVRRRQYEADVRRSPGIRAALGGILGCGIYALLELWLPQSNITAEFFLNLGAFACGLVAWVVFLSIQRGLGKLIRIFEPDPISSSAKVDREK